jgi:oligosaccharide reducing-end xylanase
VDAAGALPLSAALPKPLGCARRLVATLLALAFAASCATSRGERPGPASRPRPAARPQRTAADGAGAYATGRYRNLFLEAGHRQQEVDAKIEAAYRQLFHGDPATERLYTPSGENGNGPLAYIPDVQHHDVRSEGMSYGMMITVQLDRKAEFDALWNWSLTHMYHAEPKHPSYGFFSWQMAYDGSVMDELPAPDGEEYYAMALLFAANRWGSGQGIYDYCGQAERLLDHIVHREPITGPVRQRGGVRQHTVGREVHDQPPMILFSPDERNGFTDTSYHLPAFYELWARWGPERDRAFWAQAATVSRDFFVKATDPKTGLAPNLSGFDGTPLGFRGPGSAAFREDAWRVALNWSVDWSWWAKDPRERELSDRIQSFFESQGLDRYGDNWTLDGRMLRDRHSPGLVATNGAASLAATDAERARRFVEALWSLEVPKSEVFRYYDGLLYLMSLMHAAGRFRVIEPREGSRSAFEHRPSQSSRLRKRSEATVMIARPSSSSVSASGQRTRRPEPRRNTPRMISA